MSGETTGRVNEIHCVWPVDLPEISDSTIVCPSVSSSLLSPSRASVTVNINMTMATEFVNDLVSLHQPNLSELVDNHDADESMQCNALGDEEVDIIADPSSWRPFPVNCQLLFRGRKTVSVLRVLLCLGQRVSKLSEASGHFLIYRFINMPDASGHFLIFRFINMIIDST